MTTIASAIGRRECRSFQTVDARERLRHLARDGVRPSSMMSLPVWQRTVRSRVRNRSIGRASLHVLAATPTGSARRISSAIHRSRIGNDDSPTGHILAQCTRRSLGRDEEPAPWQAGVLPEDDSVR